MDATRLVAAAAATLALAGGIAGCVSSGDEVFPSQASGPQAGAPTASSPAPAPVPPIASAVPEAPRPTESAAVTPAPLPTDPGPSLAVPTAPPGGVEGAEELLRAAQFTRADFPTGWSARGKATSAGVDGAFGRRVERCLGLDAGYLTDPGADADADADDLAAQPLRAGSRTFTSAEGDRVRSAAVLAEREAIDAFFNAVSGAALPGCVGDALDAAVADQLAADDNPRLDRVRFDPARVTPLRFPTLGQESVAVRAVLTARGGGRTFDTVVDLVFVRLADIAAVLTYQGSGRPLPLADTERFSQAVITRLQAPASSRA
ncbi:MAG: hypothetical protein ACT4P1_13170 [Sporichthyaceae bacterium]